MPETRVSSQSADLIPTAELAKRLYVDVRTVHRMVKRGQLIPAMRLPGTTGAYLFPADAADHISWDRSC